MPFEDPNIRNQVQNVIESVDMTGSSPAGVYQGGATINGQQVQGLYRGGGLPSRPLGYYLESDVWQSLGPGTGTRLADRLIFGANGEVYYTPNHYNSFVQIR